MPFSEYLSILRNQFLPSFGTITEAEAAGFFDAGVEVVHAAYLIGEGFGPDFLLRKV